MYVCVYVCMYVCGAVLSRLERSGWSQPLNPRGDPPGGVSKVLGFRVFTFDTQRLDRLYGVRQASCLAMAFSSPSLTWAARSGALMSLAERSDSFGLSRGGSEPSARFQGLGCAKVVARGRGAVNPLAGPPLEVRSLC